MPAEKRLFYISAHFPPCAASGVFRTLGLLNNLVEAGWQTTVLSIKDIAEERLDDKLLSRVPAEVKQLRTGYIDPFRLKRLISPVRSPDERGGGTPVKNDQSSKESREESLREAISFLLKTPDSYIGWLVPGIVRAVFTAQRPDVILATAPPFSALLLGVILKKIWRRPLVVDFRDPWVLNPFRMQRPSRVERWDRFLEQWVIRNADQVIMNTEEARTLYAKIYEGVNFTAVYNGFDDRFENLDADDSRGEGRKRTIVHVGALYGKRDPAPLLDAMQGCMNVQLDLFGPGGERHGGEGVPDGVAFHAPVPHEEAIRLQKGADVTLVIGNCMPGSAQVPAKLFEAVAVSKVLWLIDVPDSPARSLLRANGIPHLFCENTINGIKEIVSRIETDQLPGLAREKTEVLSRSHQAKKLNTILEGLCLK